MSVRKLALAVMSRASGVNSTTASERSRASRVARAWRFDSRCIQRSPHRRPRAAIRLARRRGLLQDCARWPSRDFACSSTGDLLGCRCGSQEPFAGPMGAWRCAFGSSQCEAFLSLCRAGSRHCLGAGAGKPALDHDELRAGERAGAAARPGGVRHGRRQSQPRRLQSQLCMASDDGAPSWIPSQDQSQCLAGYHCQEREGHGN